MFPRTFWTSLLNYCSVTTLDLDLGTVSKNDMESPPRIKFQIAILAEAPDGMEELSDMAPVEWLFCKKTGSSFDFYKGNAIASSINLENACFDLQNLLGIIVVGSTEAFATIQSNWTSKLPSLGIAFRRTSRWDSNAILCAAVECMADVLTLQRSHSGRAALDLATYRREFERLQHSFSRLEEYIGHRSFQRPTEIFEYPPDTATATETTGRARPEDVPGGRCLIQYLPVDSLGVSSFSIYISAKPESATGPLRIQLKAIETEHIFGLWSINAAVTPIGWVQFSLNYAIDDPALSLVIVVQWPDESGWGLALGPPHPHREFCARTETGDPLRAPIGLRIFSSLPGVRVSATTTAIRPINAPEVLAEFIPYEVYGTVAQVSPPVQDDKSILVSYGQDIGCITVHPRVGGLTVARMNVVVPKHTWGLSAQIHLAHERASPTQFGLMVCAPTNESRELLRLGQLDTSSPTFSGWKTLSSLETKSISVLLPASREERLSIYLVTRQAPDLSPDFAWARFSKFEFSVLPKLLIGENETHELASGGDSCMPARNT